MRSRRSKPVAQSSPLRMPWRDLSDVLVLGLWSAVLLRYWLGGKLLLLLHPDYAWLAKGAAVVLLLLAFFTLFKVVSQLFQQRRRSARAPLAVTSSAADQSHVTLLPPSFSSAVLIGVAVFGLLYTPKAFASQTAAQRGISDTLTLTRAQPQRFVRVAAPAERSIIDWIRLVNVYPEPDEYAGESVDVKGFVIHPEEWPADYLMVSRFVLTCCAADAYPVGLPVKLLAGNQAKHPIDSWIEVKGEMITETLDGRRQIAILPTDIQAIEEPQNPYEY